jgi:ABC-type transport system involved in cytochrome bd biosynthesis fused ATPase/permease subunit
MDEATASIDIKTEEIIHKLTQQEFKKFYSHHSST